MVGTVYLYSFFRDNFPVNFSKTKTSMIQWYDYRITKRSVISKILILTDENNHELFEGFPYIQLN